MIQTNFFAVLLAAIAGTVVGFVWYGPLFGKTWSALAGLTQKDAEVAKEKGMGVTYTINFIVTLVMAYVLGNSLMARGITTVGGAMYIAFWIWLGFMATVMLSSVLWQKMPVKLYLINTLGYLAIILVMGIVLVLV